MSTGAFPAASERIEERPMNMVYALGSVVVMALMVYIIYVLAEQKKFQ